MICLDAAGGHLWTTTWMSADAGASNDVPTAVRSLADGRTALAAVVGQDTNATKSGDLAVLLVGFKGGMRAVLRVKTYGAGDKPVVEPVFGGLLPLAGGDLVLLGRASLGGKKMCAVARFPTAAVHVSRHTSNGWLRWTRRFKRELPDQARQVELQAPLRWKGRHDLPQRRRALCARRLQARRRGRLRAGQAGVEQYALRRRQLVHGR